MERIGDYEVREVLGRGAAATVFRASSPRLGREVALKLVPWSTASDVQRKRFQREAEALSKIRHPNVIAVHEVGLSRSGAFLAMDLVPGRSLEEVLARDGPLPVRRALEVGAALARALDAVHHAGLIHRDVKPANVLVREDGQPILCDFGLVRDADPAARADLTRTGVFMGTPSYWPPEQALGDLPRVGPASDVYALGATLHACLTGEAPFQAVSVADALDLAAHGAAPAASRRRAELAPSADPVPPGLDALVRRCMAKEPDARPAAALDVALALEALLSPGARRGRRVSSARPPRFAIGAAGVAVALTVAAGAAWRAARVQPPRAPSTDRGSARTGSAGAVASGAGEPAAAATPARGPTASTALERARSHAAAGEARAAVAAYDEVLREEPRLAAAWFERAGARIALANRLREPDPGADIDAVVDAAIADLDELVRLEPRHADGLLTRAQLRVARGGDPALSKADLDRALAIGPEGAPALCLRGEVRIDLRDLDGALADLDRALVLSPGLPLALAHRGVVHVRRGELESAFADLDRAVAAGRRDPWVLVNRALARTGRPGEEALALDDLDAAAAGAPRDPWIGMNQAVVRAQSGDLAGALRNLDRVVEGADPARADVAQALAARGALRANSGDARGALPDFDLALRTLPDEVDARMNRAVTRRKVGDAQGALVDLDHAVRVAPDLPGPRFERASSRDAAGDRAGAADDLRAFLRGAAPDDPRVATARRWFAEHGLRE